MPVEAMVAAILRATWPDLPMPVQITRPLAARMVSTALTKRSSRLRASWVERLGFKAEDAAGGCDMCVLRHAAGLNQF